MVFKGELNDIFVSESDVRRVYGEYYMYTDIYTFV